MAFRGIVNSYTRRTITRDLALMLALAVVIVLLVLALLYYFISVRQAEQNLQDQAVKLADVLVVPLWDLDLPAIEQIAEACQQTENVLALHVFDKADTLLYQSHPFEQDVIVQDRPIVYQGQQIGRVEVFFSRQGVRTVQQNSLISALVILFVVVFLVVLMNGVLLQRFLNRPLVQLIEGIDTIAGGDYYHHLTSVRQVDVNAIIEKVNLMASQIAERDKNFEQQVADHARDLRRHSLQLQAAADVGRAAASILETEQLLHQVVSLIEERFGFYHTAVFLLDETGRWAEYRAGTGKVGELLREQGLRLEFGGRSMVGWCTANSQARIASDASQDAVRADHPYLSDTRSEVALPLIARGLVIGALDVQSDELDAFDPETLTVLQTMSDQVAVALGNARLFAESQTALESAQRAYGEVSRDAWVQMLRLQPNLRYVCDAQNIVKPVAGDWRADMLQTIRQGQIVQDSERGISMPIKIRDQAFGSVRFRKPGDAGEWTQEELALAETLTRQLGEALENARLYQDTQQRAERERVAAEVTAHMRETLDLEVVLKTAVREISQALGLAALDVKLGIEFEHDLSDRDLDRE